MNRYWIWYFAGIMAPFIIKYANYMLKQSETVPMPASLEGKVMVTEQRWSFTIATLRFLFGDTALAIKTLTNFGAEWVIGAVVLDRLPVPFAADVLEMPQHIGLAFFMGLIAESLIVPPFMNLVVGWLTRSKPTTSNP